jgi:hypothetical protein
MYLIQGSTKDFNYGSQGSVAWSIEISVDKQPAGPNIQHYYNINKPAMLAMIEQAGYGLEGTITDAITGMPVKAAVWVGANYPSFTDGEAGDYHKYVVPGTYTLKFTANSYQTQTVENVLVNSLSSTVTNVQLQPVSTQFAFRTGFCRIPGFSAQNPGDEGYTAACLGEPDQVNYSLGKGGYIMVDMQNPVVNESGNDIEVLEGDTSPEGYSMYALATPDSYWNYIGSGTGTTQFDLETAQLDSARYFVVWDDNNGTANVDNAGFDFDALRNLHPAIPDTLAGVYGYVYDSFSGLIIPEAQIQIGDSIVFTDSTGYYNDSQLRGNQLICASMPNYITECDTLLLLAGQTTHHDFFLLSNVGISPVDKSEGMIVCPNPIRSEFEIRFRLEKPQPVVIQLYSLNGLLISELNNGFYEVGNHVLKINTKSEMAEIAPGCYLLSLELPDKKITTKVIKLP